MNPCMSMNPYMNMNININTQPNNANENMNVNMNTYVNERYRTESILNMSRLNKIEIKSNETITSKIDGDKKSEVGIDSTAH